jgi:hypothetical protein
MSAAQEPSPPTSSEGQRTGRSEGEQARAAKQPLDLTLSPEEVPDVVRFVSEMRAKKAMNQGQTNATIQAALVNSVMELTKAVNALREAAQPMFDAHK